MSTIEIFFSYSHKDEALREELEKQLSLLKWQGLIASWHDRRIVAGQEWADEIDVQLNSARIILLLVSPDFIASDYCYGVEVKRAMERHEAGEALVIPIILRPVDWQNAPFGKFQALPKDSQPVTSWSNTDEAFLDIARGIRKAIEELTQDSLTSRHTREKSASQRTNNKKNIQHLQIGQCPYRGLLAFQEEDEPYFLGRETFTQQLVADVHQKPLVVVLGSSGSGKSSVVYAGLIPYLRKERNWLISSLRPGNRPVRSLAVALMPLLEPHMSERARLLESNKLAQQLQQSKLSLQDVVELIMLRQVGRRLLLVIDQFEELYTLCRESAVRERFLDELISTAQAAYEYDFLRFNLVLTLRADFLGQALTHRLFADALQDANLMLGPMTTQELQDTIRKPAQMLNVGIEDGLTERILSEVKQGGNRLPLLEFALTLLWEKQKNAKLTHSGYEEIGGVEKALTDHAEKVFAGLSEAEQVRAQQVFIQLVSFGEGTEDTRRIATRAEIGEDNWKLVMRLSGASARLVVSGRDQTSGEETVEVVHEALIRGWERLCDWMEDNREFRIWQEHLRTALRQWEKSNRDDGALLHGALLVEAAKWMTQRSEDISKQEQAFIDISQQYQEKEAQRWKALYEESQRFALLYQAEQELSKLTEMPELEQAYDVILRVAEKHSQSQVVIRRYDKFNEELVLSGAIRRQDLPLFTRIRLDEGVNGQVARERHTIMIDDTNNPHPGMAPAKLSDPSMRSIVIIPIMFKERYYGNLGVSHKEVGHFQDTDISFYEGLAQQLASTIYRLELAQARLEFEKRALSAEEMSSIGQSAYQITHRLGNDLGLVELYIADIEQELEAQGITNSLVSTKLEGIAQSVKKVLYFSGDLKRELTKSGVSEALGNETTIISPRALLEEARVATSLPSNISISLMADEHVANVRIFHSLVADILRNLVLNAIQAMPQGGNITLRTRNIGHLVALEVTDTGIGIPPQNLSQIFDLFFSTKGSTGFGLWSARRNALRNQGDIKVESRQGEGTTFTLLLPRIDA